MGGAHRCSSLPDTISPVQNEKFANFKSICSQMRVSGGWEVMILADWKRG